MPQFQTEVYVILACIKETETQDRPEKYVSICSDSQAALKALQAAKTTSPLLRQCQQELNDISARPCCGAILGPWACWSALLSGSLDLSLSWGFLGRI